MKPHYSTKDLTCQNVLAAKSSDKWLAFPLPACPPIRKAHRRLSLGLLRNLTCPWLCSNSQSLFQNSFSSEANEENEKGLWSRLRSLQIVPCDFATKYLKQQMLQGSAEDTFIYKKMVVESYLKVLKRKGRSQTIANAFETWMFNNSPCCREIRQLSHTATHGGTWVCAACVSLEKRINLNKTCI